MKKSELIKLIKETIIQEEGNRNDTYLTSQNFGDIVEYIVQAGLPLQTDEQMLGVFTLLKNAGLLNQGKTSKDLSFSVLIHALIKSGVPVSKIGSITLYNLLKRNNALNLYQGNE